MAGRKDLAGDDCVTMADGEPVIQGVPVARILESLAEGVVADQPGLSAEVARAALTHAAMLVRRCGEAPGESADSSPPDLDLNKVLVVDDVEDGRVLVQRILGHEGFDVSLAASGAEALTKAQAEHPFLIISDIMMPQMDGFELCEKLKAHERTRDAGIIFITAYPGDSERISQGLDLGADDYIGRPFHARELVARVQAVARVKRAEIDARQRADIVARRNQELEFLNDLAVSIGALPGLWEAVAALAPRLRRLLGAEAVGLLLLEAQGRLNVNLASPDGEEVAFSLDLDASGDADVASFQEPQIRRILSELPGDAANGLEARLSAGDLALALVPVVSQSRQDQPVGAIAVLYEERACPAAADLMLLNSAAGVLGVALENARLFDKVQGLTHHLERMVEARTQQLIEEEKKTAAIVASMADGLLVLDAAQRVLTANKAAQEMLGFQLDSMQGKPIDEERLASPLWRCVHDMVTRDVLTLSASVDLPDETRPAGVLSIEARSARMWDEDGQPTGTVIVLRDNTALKEVEQMKVRFMAGVTHELKTPLSVIRVYADNLSTYHRRLPRGKREEMLGTIQRQVALLDQLVEDILDTTRMDIGAIRVDRRLVDLGALVDEVVLSMRPLAETKRIAMRWVKPSVALTMSADDRLIRRVVRNLVDNALKYTPGGGSVEVRALAMPIDGHPFVGAEVSDTGPGIAPVHQARVFERFYRVDPSHTVPGTGLGLAVVKEIVEAHGGEIRLQSTPGQGSAFTVMLPAIEGGAEDSDRGDGRS